MRFDPQANFVSETERVRLAPMMAPPPALEARSPLKTALVIVVIGFVGGIGMWIWSEGMPGQKNAAADTKSTVIDDSIVQYAEALLSNKTSADRVEAATGLAIEQRLSGEARRTDAYKAGEAFDNGKTAWSMGDKRGAIEHFSEAVRIDPNFAEAHYRLGIAYVRTGDIAAARKEQAFLTQLGDDRANLLGHLVDN